MVVYLRAHPVELLSASGVRFHLFPSRPLTQRPQQHLCRLSTPGASRGTPAFRRPTLALVHSPVHSCANPAVHCNANRRVAVLHRLHVTKSDTSPRHVSRTSSDVTSRRALAHSPQPVSARSQTAVLYTCRASDLWLRAQACQRRCFVLRHKCLSPSSTSVRRISTLIYKHALAAHSRLQRRWRTAERYQRNVVACTAQSMCIRRQPTKLNREEDGADWSND